MRITVCTLVIFLCFCTWEVSCSVVPKSKNGEPLSKEDQATLDKKVLMEDDDEDDYEDTDTLDLPVEEQKRRLKILVETKIDEDKDGFIDMVELQKWTLKAYDNFEVDDLREELPLIDQDKDGVISWEEHAEDLFGHDFNEQSEKFSNPVTEDDKANAETWRRDKLLFDAADSDNNAQLNLAEMVVFKHPRRGELTKKVVVEDKLRKLDTDGDGKLSADEFVKDNRGDDGEKEERERFEDELDQDKDGFLDQEEILHWLEPDNQVEAEDEADHLMSECDTNTDQKLSLDEIVNNHNLWIDSDATDYGRYIMNHDEF